MKKGAVCVTVCNPHILPAQLLIMWYNHKALPTTQQRKCLIIDEYQHMHFSHSTIYESRTAIPNRGSAVPLGYREHFLGVPRDVEITNVL